MDQITKNCYHKTYFVNGDFLVFRISRLQPTYLYIDRRLHQPRVAHLTAAKRPGHTGPTTREQQENRTTFFFHCIVCVHAKTQSAQNSFIQLADTTRKWINWPAAPTPRPPSAALAKLKISKNTYAQAIKTVLASVRVCSRVCVCVLCCWGSKHFLVKIGGK